MSGFERWRLGVAGLAVAIALAACGGGGSSTPANGASTALAQEPGAPTLTNNIQADGLAWINYRRAQIGIPVLLRNSLVDKAAQNHSDYQNVNNVVSHDETAGLPDFTGVRTQDRLAAAGYVFGSGGYAGEVISATSSNSGFFMAEELITAIYHRFAIFEPKFTQIGTGAATNGKGYTYFTTDFTTPDSSNAGLGRGAMVTWPANNQTLVPTNFFSDNETPDPVDGVNEVGYPISVHADITSVIVVNSFTVRPRGGSDMNAKLLQPGGDIHTANSVAALIPLAVLKSGTTYDVTFNGSVDTVPVNKSWSFTTK